MPKASKHERLVIIDANALIHRGFHALPPNLRTTKGVLVNGVYGFTSTLLNVIKELKPEYAIAAFDVDKKTFRHTMYADYKGTRQAAPQELYDQIPIVKDVVRAMNIPILEKAGYEADDMIGMLNAIIDQENQKRSEPIDVYIVTGDKDTLQLIDSNTRVYTLKRGFNDAIIYDADKVREEFGFGPERVVDYKALRGDPSDNIPGVPGVGEKTAIQLIQNFGDLDSLYEKLSTLKPGKTLKGKKMEVKGKLLENLQNNREKAYLSKELATIVTKPVISLKLKDSVLHDFDRQKVVELFQELQFKSLLRRLPDAPQEHNTKPGRTLFDVMQEKGQDIITEFAKKNTQANYHTIDSTKSLNALVAKLKKAKLFAIDTETTSITAMRAELVGLSFAVKGGEAYYIPVGHIMGKQLPRVEVLTALKPILESATYKKIGHNYKYDWLVLRNAGIRMDGLFFDTLLAPYVLEPGARGLDLDNLAFAEFGYEMMPISAVIGSGKKQKSFAEVPIEGATFYAAEDADYTFRLYENFSKQLAKRPDAKKIFETMEIPLVPVLGEMEFTGIELDPKALARVSKKFEKRITLLTTKIFKIAGTEFNINSSQQIGEILFEKLNLPSLDIKKTQKGYSTAASELAKLKGYPIVDLLHEYRELTKLKNTYLDALPALVNPKTGRLHTTFNQTIAATGRLSSTDPNLQNIPIRTPQGQQVREGFRSRKGWKLLALDYSQIELRIMAHLSKSPRFIEAFENNEDVHRAVAAAVSGVFPEDVTDEQRREAKIVNFAILYGVSAYGLAQQTSMDVHAAREYIDKYFELNPEVRKLIDEIKLQAHRDGYVETIFGRRRYFPEINAQNPVVRQAAERAAINMPFQGANADIMKLAMLKIYREIPYLRDKLLLQVHDELIFELPPKEIKRYAKQVKAIMENIATLAVPLKVDVEVGENWNGLEKIDL